MPPLEVTGLLMAGGKSRRIGTDKGLLLYQGKTLFERAVQTLAQCCNPILISASAANYDYFGYRRVTDYINGAGPIGGLMAGLTASRSEKILVMTIDMPNLTADFLKHLIEESGDAPAAAPVLPNGKAEPLCAVYQKSAIPVVEKMITNGDYKVQNLLEYLHFKPLHVYQTWKPYHPDLFLNINTLQDYQKLL
jgi:molybdopterin-guanine dinucleotide biosynthesis protein A